MMRKLGILLLKTILEIQCVVHQVRLNGLLVFILFPLFASGQTAAELFNKGVASYNAKDYVNAVRYYEQAAFQGHDSAQCNMGFIYVNGILGVKKDYKKAFNWYLEAATNGNAIAQYNLGIMYNRGKGCREDKNLAFLWFEKSAMQGYANAQQNLGFMYENGKGVNKDLAKAVEWYEKAAAQGNKMAASYADAIRKKNPNLKVNTTPSNQTQTAYSPQQTASQSVTAQIQSSSAMPVAPQKNKDIINIDIDIPTVSNVNKTTFAIIIANENYQKETKVDYALNDGKIFKSYCHKTLGLPEKNIHYIPNSTLNNLIDELEWLRQVCEAYNGEASVIFYYAGHGVPDEKSGSAYLLPIDGNSRIMRTCFSISELYETLGTMQAKKVSVLMDACFSGSQRSGEMLTAARGVAIKAKPSTPKGNMFVLTAAQGDETAYKYEMGQHGLFTYFLLKKLNETKGNVTFGELSEFVKTEVKRFSIVENGKSQTPSVRTSGSLSKNWKSMKFN